MWIHVGLPSIARFIISKRECIGIGKIEFSSRYFNWIITLCFLFLINWSTIYFSIKSIENLLPFAGRVWPIGKRNQEIKTIGMRCKCAVRWDTCFDAKLHNNKVIMHSRWGFSLRKMQIYINMINILRFAISFSFPSFCDAVECGSQAHRTVYSCSFPLRLVYCSITAIENGISRRRGKQWTLPIGFVC